MSEDYRRSHSKQTKQHVLSHFFKRDFTALFLETTDGFFIKEILGFRICLHFGRVFRKNNFKDLFTLLFEEEVVCTQGTLWLILWFFLTAKNLQKMSPESRKCNTIQKQTADNVLITFVGLFVATLSFDFPSGVPSPFILNSYHSGMTVNQARVK